MNGMAAVRRSGARTSRPRLVSCLAALLLAATLVPFLAAREPSSLESLKAAYLVNFGQFTTWPDRAFAAAGAPFVIGIIGPDPLGGALDGLVRGADVGGRRLEVRRLTTGDQIRQCQILFVGRVSAREFRRMIDIVGTAPVLTISDERAFIDAGGMVEFHVEHDRLRFDVNAAAARRAGLVLSSEMLQFARKVSP